jgi:hypothetical protein
MAIVTTAQVKTILGIGSTSYDTKIAAMIPYVQSDVCDYCGTYFQDGYIWRSSGTELKITRGTTGVAADKLTDASGELTNVGFLAGDDVAIEGGHSNVGVHTVATIHASTMTFTSTAVMRTQDPGSTGSNYMGALTVSRVRWPKGIQLAAAKMVWHLIDKPTPSGIQSESIDDYSVSYAGSHAYPAEVVSQLKAFKVAFVR